MRHLPLFSVWGSQLFQLFGGLRLNSRDRDGIDNVIHAAPSAQIVDWFFEPLQNRADGNRSCLSLHRFVGIVACIQIRKYQNTGRFTNRRSGLFLRRRSQLPPDVPHQC